MSRRLTAKEIADIQQGRRRRLNALTQRAAQGDFAAFRERQKMLSRDPVDLELEWQQFQEEEKGGGRIPETAGEPGTPGPVP